MLRAPRRDFILSGRRHGGHAQAAGTRQSGPRLARLEPGRSCRAGASSATLATRSQASEISQAIEKLTGRKIKTGFPFAWKAGFYVRERIALSRQRRLLQLRQESCQQADQRQESADLIHKENIGHVSQLAQQCRANTTHAERETEEQTRHGADLPGISSCANTRIAEKADARIMPMMTVNTPVQNRLAYGSISVNGATPRIDTQITSLRPTRSPIGPPTTVPMATANKNTNR